MPKYQYVIVRMTSYNDGYAETLEDIQDFDTPDQAFEKLDELVKTAKEFHNCTVEVRRISPPENTLAE